MPIPTPTLVAALLVWLAAALPAPAHGTMWVPPEPPVVPDSAPGEVGGPPPSSTGGGGPNAPGAPNTGSPGLGAAKPSLPSTAPGTINRDELTNWSYWWFFNREPLLDLRRRFDDQARLSGLGAAGQLIPSRPSEAALKNTVLPALFALAGDKRQDNVRLSAGIAMARIGQPLGPEIRAQLEEHIASNDPALQEAALLGLGLYGDFWSLQTLTAALTDDRGARKTFGGKLGTRERAFAAYGLGVMADRAPHDAQRAMVLVPLWDTLLDAREDREVRVAVANALGLVRLAWDSDRAIPGVDEDKASTPKDRRTLVQALWEAYDDEADVFVRAHLSIALARLTAGGPDDVRDALIERFIDALEARRGPRAQDQHGLLIGLGILGTAWGRESDVKLRATLYRIAVDEGDAHARHMALMSLASVAANAAPSLPPQSVQAEFEAFLVESLKDARSLDKPWLALAAGSFGARLRKPTVGRSPGRLGVPLIAALREIVDAAGSPNTLSAAVLALGLAEDFDSGATVERLFDRTRNKDVQGYAALTLGLLGRNGAIPKLEVLLDDARYSPVVIEHTALGLALLSRPRAIATLTERLATAHSGLTAAPLAAVLGHVGDATTVLPLTTLSTDKNATLATLESIALALGLISRPVDLTWRASLATDVNYAAWVPSLFDQAGSGLLNIN